MYCCQTMIFIYFPFQRILELIIICGYRVFIRKLDSLTCCWNCAILVLQTGGKPQDLTKFGKSKPLLCITGWLKYLWGTVWEDFIIKRLSKITPTKHLINKLNLINFIICYCVGFNQLCHMHWLETYCIKLWFSSSNHIFVNV